MGQNTRAATAGGPGAAPGRAARSTGAVRREGHGRYYDFSGPVNTVDGIPVSSSTVSAYCQREDNCPVTRQTRVGWGPVFDNANCRVFRHCVRTTSLEQLCPRARPPVESLNSTRRLHGPRKRDLYIIGREGIGLDSALHWVRCSGFETSCHSAFA